MLAKSRDRPENQQGDKKRRHWFSRRPQKTTTTTRSLSESLDGLASKIWPRNRWIKPRRWETCRSLNWTRARICHSIIMTQWSIARPSGYKSSRSTDRVKHNSCRSWITISRRRKCPQTAWTRSVQWCLVKPAAYLEKVSRLKIHN